ncbi:unnamed protein product [Echinostoma caproni]|uniref:Integrase catalytic domain-containing protein n=1 Tax=Echinostoma caproni TaxID=27848 RepID=A0A183B4Y5_9TREM|nr:unnamed protein product [Echinostoma caproni]
MQSRAVHLKMVHSMSTESFLMALQRLIGRRGVPSNIYSDNGSNFAGASDELQRWLSRVDQSELHKRLTSKAIQWHFNPPYASHRGGIWERMIRTNSATISGVYRSPGATIEEDEQLIRALDVLAQSQQKLVIAGDFNLPCIQWTCSEGAPEEVFPGWI